MKPTQEMIDRFLGWKLPADFAPDAGVSFDREYAAKWGMPTGTNLMTADQARQMLEYIFAGSEAPPQRQPLTDEEIWKFWWDRPAVPEGEDDSMEAEFVAACRRVLAAAHGIGNEA